MKTCLSCDAVLFGRIDKKYCDYNCRNAYHNEKGRKSSGIMRSVNRKLYRNYSILEELKVHAIKRINLQVLHTMGFDESYNTAYFNDRVDGAVRFIYDQAYQQIGAELVLLERELEYYRNTA